MQVYEYLASARARLFDWVARLTVDKYARKFPVGHGSVRSTLVHVAGAEWGCVRRLRGEPGNGRFSDTRRSHFRPCGRRGRCRRRRPGAPCVHHRAQVMFMLQQLGQRSQNLDYSALRFEVEELDPQGSTWPRAASTATRAHREPQRTASSRSSSWPNRQAT